MLVATLIMQGIGLGAVRAPEEKANQLAFFLFSFKYILCTVTDPEKPADSKEIIRGTAMAEFHGTLLLNAQIFLHMLGSLFNACQ